MIFIDAFRNVLHVKKNNNNKAKVYRDRAILEKIFGALGFPKSAVVNFQTSH